MVTGFRDAGWRVCGTSRTPRGQGDQHLPLDDLPSIRQVISTVQPDVVVHLAGIAHRRASNEEYRRVNHHGTATLVQAVAECAPGTVFVYASSANVYGDGPFDGPRREEHEVSPIGPYAISKFQGEEAIRAYGSMVRGIVFRFPALYAPDWLLNIRKRTYLPKPFAGLGVRLIGRHGGHSFCAVENAVAAALLAASGHMAAGVYNIADATPYSQLDVATVVSTHDGRPRYIPLPIGLVRPLYWTLSACLPGETRERARGMYHKLVDGMVLDCSRAIAAGYRPTVTLKDVLTPNPTHSGS